MVGASASVLAIVLATLTEAQLPDKLTFIGTVRLKYIALFVVLTDLLFITSDNGGDICTFRRSIGPVYGLQLP